MNQLSWVDFKKVEMRIGTILSAKHFEAANKPAYLIQVDFGDFGIKKTSAQITKRYSPESLIGKQVVAVTNLPPKQIANIMSECLLLGAVEEPHNVTLLTADQKVPNGTCVA